MATNPVLYSKSGKEGSVGSIINTNHRSINGVKLTPLLEYIAANKCEIRMEKHRRRNGKEKKYSHYGHGFNNKENWTQPSSRTGSFRGADKNSKRDHRHNQMDRKQNKNGQGRGSYNYYDKGAGQMRKDHNVDGNGTESFWPKAILRRPTGNDGAMTINSKTSVTNFQPIRILKRNPSNDLNMKMTQLSLKESDKEKENCSETHKSSSQDGREERCIQNKVCTITIESKYIFAILSTK